MARRLRNPSSFTTSRACAARRRPPSLFEYDETGLSLPSVITCWHQFQPTRILVKITLKRRPSPASDPVTLAGLVDGKQISSSRLNAPTGRRIPLIPDSHRERRTPDAVSFLSQFEGPAARFKGQSFEEPDPAAHAWRRTHAARHISCRRVEALDIGGPFDAAPSPPTEDPPPNSHLRPSGRKAHRRVSTKNYFRAGPPRLSRPLTRQDTDALLALYSKVRSKAIPSMRQSPSRFSTCWCRRIPLPHGQGLAAAVGAAYRQTSTN